MGRLGRPFTWSCALLAPLLGLLAACGGGPGAQREILLDLAASLDLAEVEREPGVVDLGTPAARPLLRRGWSQDEATGDRTFVWSDGPESELEFFLTAPRDLPLFLRGEPYQFPGAPAQAVEVVVNGKLVRRISDLRGSTKADVVLKERDLRAGTNRLVLRYAWTRSPSEVTAGSDRDPRRLAMAWDLLRFGTGADERAGVRAAAGQLALPFGYRVSRYLRLPPGAVLAIAGLRSRDGRSGELRVVLQPEGGAEREVARLRARRQTKEDAAMVRLNAATSEPVRISIAAVAGGEGGGGLVLRQPIVAAPLQRGPHERPAAAAGAPAAAGRPRNVVLYLVDALRADHLGCYGYGQPVSPHVDAFAREAALFRHAVAQAPWTRPSVATILTGLLPRTHGVNRKRHALAAEAVTLAEVLRERGYRSAGFVTNGNVARAFGIGQGFDTYQLLPHKHHSAADVNAQAAAWLEAESGKGDAPFFLYLHTVEPHAPYNPPPPFRQRFAPGVHGEELTGMHVFKLLGEGRLAPTPALRRDLLALYDAEIATNDAAFGELRDLLVRRGLWDDTIVVFLSDHGEEFLDHGGWQHGGTLHAEMLDVPLIVRIPGAGNGRVVTRQVQHADVMPTILAALHLSSPPSVQGRSFLTTITGEGAPDAGVEEAFSWLDEFGVAASAATTPEWRLIAARAPVPETTLYDRRSDPGERRNLAPDRPVRTGYLAARLHAAEHPAAAALRPTEGTSSAELRRQLRALGYAAH